MLIILANLFLPFFIPVSTDQAAEERQKQLERWRERKALEKEKEMREKARKGVFKTGLFHAKDSNTLVPLPQVPAASTRAKEVSKDLSTDWFALCKVCQCMCLSLKTLI